MEIIFKNGNSIKTIGNHSDNSDMTSQVIGIDLADENSKVLSCISYKCSNCNTVFKVDIYDKNTEVNLFNKCPICGKRFKGWLNVK